MRGQSRKRQIQKKSLREEERFINAKKTSHPEELAKLKKEIPVVFQVLAMFFGFAGHGACHNCKRIGKILKLTKNEAHALKWRGLQLLGWEVEGDYFERKTEAILLKLSNRQQQEGENKMAGKFKFSFGPWNIHEGADPFGPAVRRSITLDK
ncbi:hypothetical protein L6252_01405, partial [Candidatus Parcubacteria bacterium]|nr:hypothetical protein [Candidatus Parcubacteria bacterium]